MTISLQQRIAHDVSTLVRIPTVARIGRQSVAFDESAKWLADRLTTIGMQHTWVTKRHGAPAVVSFLPPTPGSPTVLLYAHHDVVASSTFQPTRHGPYLHGRGTSDDKGPLVAMLYGLERYLSDPASTGFEQPSHLGIVFVIDGEEELGSPNLPGLLREARSRSGPVHALLAIDTQASQSGRPALTVGLRGQTTVDLDIVGPPERHSGRYSGSTPDPGLILAAILATLSDGEGRTRSKRLTVAINALSAGTRQRGPHHVIPACARAKLNFRFDHLTPDQVLDHLTGIIASRLLFGTQAHLRTWLAVRPWSLTTTNSPFVHLVLDELDARYGSVELVHSAATLPVASIAEDVMDVDDIALIGLAQQSDGAHGANERVNVARLSSAATCVHAVLSRFGRTR